MDVIDRFVAQLERTLSGPRRAKADMVNEIRDGLHDAADAHRCSGLDADAAQQCALAEFGTVKELAPALQAELAMTQARRTALLIIVVLAGQPLVWAAVDAFLTAGSHPGHGGPGYALVNALTQWTGTGMIIACLLASVLVTGPGARRLGYPTGVARAVGALGYAACPVFAALGAALTLLGPAPSPWTPAGLPTTAVLLGAPLLGVGVAARRCLRAAHA
jgi:hypothetical protein